MLKDLQRVWVNMNKFTRVYYRVRYGWHDWSWLTKLICKTIGHDDVVWYSNGLEPDMHCKRCGEDLG